MPSACAAPRSFALRSCPGAWRAAWRWRARSRSTRCIVLYDEPFAGLDPISLGVVGQLIRKLNDALGITSVVVTHDVYESLKIVDYLYFVSDGRIIWHGTPEDVRHSTDPFVRQFVDGEPDGPVPFHYPRVRTRSSCVPANSIARGFRRVGTGRSARSRAWGS